MRTLGVVLRRLGLVTAGGGFVCGLLVALYALFDAIDRLAHHRLGDVTRALERLVLYPLCAALAGSVVAVIGLVLMYAGDRTLDRAG